ncbi:MAG: GNAT family N-acetyltransferase [Actinomycetota bacterium]|nr:GNAT family N-acetyltransferase [Actinomycetota bacterium]
MMVANTLHGAALYQRRALSTADIPGWQQFLSRFERADPSSINYYPEEFLEDVLDGRLDPRCDTVGVFSKSILVAYAIVRAKTTDEGVFQLDLEGCVDPRHRRRGLGTELLRWSVARALQRRSQVAHRRSAIMRAWALEENIELRALLDRAGLAPTRWWYDIYGRLDEMPPLQKPPLPEGLQLVPLGNDHMSALRGVHNGVFEGQSEDGAMSSLRWEKEIISDSSLQRDLSYLVVDAAGSIASYIITFASEEDAKATGERELHIRYVGTPRRWRGLNLFKYLIATVEEGAREQKYDSLVFSVDSENPTGALRIFEHAGMFDWDRDYWECWICHSRTLSVGDPG